MAVAAAAGAGAGVLQLEKVASKQPPSEWSRALIRMDELSGSGVKPVPIKFQLNFCARIGAIPTSICFPIGEKYS